MVVDKFEGKRLNSPNDLAFGPGGALYFTDPPFGLVKQDDDPAKELPSVALPLTLSGIDRLAGPVAERGTD